MKATQDSYKSFTDVRRKPLKFDVRDMVYLKVTP